MDNMDTLDTVIEQIKTEFQTFVIEEIIIDLEEELLEEEQPRLFKCSGFRGNESISINISTKEEADKLLQILRADVQILNNFWGTKNADIFEIILSKVGRRSPTYRLRKTPLIIEINYFGKNLRLTFTEIDRDSPTVFLYINSRRRGFYNLVSLKIENLTILPNEDLNEHIRNILNSVLFDVEYNFDIALEGIEMGELDNKLPIVSRPKYPLPTEPIQFTYRSYKEELIQYLHLAEKVDNVPFKYLCYFHIIEYFSDKSSYFEIKERVKQILLKPDFHLNTDKYIYEAVNIFKHSTETKQNDRDKLRKVFEQFIEVEKLKESLENTKFYNIGDIENKTNLSDYFTKELTLNLSSELKLSALVFKLEDADTKKSDSNAQKQKLLNDKFCESLVNRIYKIRCSIVHSNPDFDSEKAVPFVHNSENNRILSIETSLIKEIARTIVMKSAFIK